MKKDSLENFVQQNRSSWDDENPPEGLFDKIYEHIPKEEKSFNVPIYQSKWIGIAAGILLPIAILSIVLFSVDSSTRVEESRKAYATAYSPMEVEMMETEAYYKREIILKENKLKSLVSNDANLTKLISETLNEFDTSFEVLNNDLQMNVNSLDIQNEIVNHQRMTLGMLADLIDQIERSKMHNE